MIATIQLKKLETTSRILPFKSGVENAVVMGSITLSEKLGAFKEK